MTNPPVLLSVAGTDSGGAAGVAADLATFAALGAHGACVVTAVTAQDTTGVHGVHRIPLDVVDAQVSAVLDDLPVAAVKTGMLGTPDVVELVARRLRDRPLVVDPVLVSTSGSVLGDDDVVAAYRERLLPVASVVTPNLDEAHALLGEQPGGRADALAVRLADRGPSVVVTGGPDGRSDGATCTDWVAVPGQDPVALEHPAVPTSNDHGTGCTFSAALAACLAHGEELLAAARDAASYTTGRLRVGAAWTLGRGRGPVAHVAGPVPH